MRVKLVIVGGKANKSRVSVELPTVIGRSREADLTIAHPMISRKHCELYEVNGLVMIKDLGSLNGLFVGDTQVSEAALNPNAEFTVGPLTFRIEYEYVSHVAASPDATTIDETNSQPQGPTAPQAPESGEEGPHLRVVAPSQPFPPPEGIAVGDQPVDAGDELTPRPQPGIAPPDGQLPDFSAWGAGGTEKAEAQEARETVPPPPPSFGVPPGQQQPMPEMGQDEPPEPAPPASSAPVAPTPITPIPETASFDQQGLAAEGPDQPLSDAAARAQAPDSSGAKAVETEAPLDQQDSGSTEEGTGGSTADRQPEPDEPEDEGMFDLSLPPAPDADEPDSTAPSDDLDEFLKGLE